ncbi:MAG: hypothetical protein ACRC8Y_03840 [Chroococcales cyanobacterium]
MKIDDLNYLEPVSTDRNSISGGLSVAFINQFAEALSAALSNLDAPGIAIASARNHARISGADYFGIRSQARASSSSN